MALQSGYRPFAEREITADGKVLPLKDFKLCHDVERQEFNDEYRALFIKDAEAALEQDLPALSLSLYRDFFITGMRSNWEKPHHTRRRMLFALTLGEMTERSGRFVTKIADLVWLICEESTWSLPAHMFCHPTNKKNTVPPCVREDDLDSLDLYAGGDCLLLGFVYHFLKDELDAISPTIRKKMAHLIYMRGIRPFLSVTYGWTGEYGGKPNNWLTVIVQDILMGTALTSEDGELRTLVVNRAIKYLDNYTAGYPTDGSCDEGPGYWSASPATYFTCLEIIEDMTGGAVKVYDHPFIKKMGEYICSANIHKKKFLNFSDAAPTLSMDGKTIMRYGEKCGSPELYSFGKMSAALNKTSIDAYARAYRTYKNAITPEITEADTVLAKRAVWFEDNKIAIFRSAENTSVGFFAATKGGSNGEAHNHKDVGCLVIYYEGEPIFMDPSHGSYNNYYFGKERYNRWYTKSSYHSIPTVNGIEQATGRSAASRDEVCDLEGRTVSMELSGAFPEEAGIVSMRRTLALEDKRVTVTDEVVAKEESDISFNFLTLDKPEQIGEGRLAVAQGRTLTYDPSLELVVEKVENTYLPYEDLAIERLWGRPCLWRIRLTAHAAAAKSVITVE
ncbi:MAG: heparinase II/III family protein [Clostridia bacterium]|nr:heparinase II/III family protein [Clostridia bacterium]